MLIATSSDTIASISQVSGSVFTSFLPYIYLIMGLILGFYIAQKLISLIYTDKVDTSFIERGNKISETIKKYDW